MEKSIRDAARQILEAHCDSMPAWTERRTEYVIDAMLDFAKQLPDLKERYTVCQCKYGVKVKNYNRCSICGGKWKKEA